MEDSNEKEADFTAFTPDPLKDLTVQDALIISAVYAVEANAEKSKRISTLAQNHPLFIEEPQNTTARVNKYVNLMQAGKSLKAVEAVTNYLNPEHRQQAFEFAIEATLEDEDLTEIKKKTLRTLANKLDLDNDFVIQKLADIQYKSVR